MVTKAQNLPIANFSHQPVQAKLACCSTFVISHPGTQWAQEFQPRVIRVSQITPMSPDKAAHLTN